jgi:hypothetical protein
LSGACSCTINSQGKDIGSVVVSGKLHDGRAAGKTGKALSTSDTSNSQMCDCVETTNIKSSATVECIRNQNSLKAADVSIQSVCCCNAITSERRQGSISD